MNYHNPNITTRRFIAIVITLVVHLLLLVLLYMLHLRSTPPPLPMMEELVLVNLGDGSVSSGKLEPQGKLEETTGRTEPKEVASSPATTIPKPQPKVQPKQRVEKTIPVRDATSSTQKNTEAEAKAEAIRKAKAESEAKAKAEAQQKAEAEQAAREEERRKQIGQSVAGAFGGKSNTATSQGTSNQEKGNQGNRQGNGDSYSLEGRNIINNGGVPTRPKISRAITGVVVVSIVVNSSGRVVDASVNPQGTNIADPAIRTAAIVAAKATQFNSVPNASEQKGRIRYRFVQ